MGILWTCYMHEKVSHTHTQKPKHSHIYISAFSDREGLKSRRKTIYEKWTKWLWCSSRVIVNFPFFEFQNPWYFFLGGSMRKISCKIFSSFGLQKMTPQATQSSKTRKFVFLAKIRHFKIFFNFDIALIYLKLFADSNIRVLKPLKA